MNTYVTHLLWDLQIPPGHRSHLPTLCEYLGLPKYSPPRQSTSAVTIVLLLCLPRCWLRVCWYARLPQYPQKTNSYLTYAFPKVGAERFKQLAQDHTFSSETLKQAIELQSRHLDLTQRIFFGCPLPFCLETFQEPRGSLAFSVELHSFHTLSTTRTSPPLSLSSSISVPQRVRPWLHTGTQGGVCLMYLLVHPSTSWVFLSTLVGLG